METDRFEADLASRQVPRIAAADRRPNWIVIHPHAPLERRDAVVGAHPEFGLGVGLGEVLTEIDRREARLEGQRELGERRGPGRRGSPEHGERDARDGQPDGRVDEVGLEIDAPPFRPDGHEPAHRRLAVAVAEPAGQPEDPDLLGRRGVHRDRAQVGCFASFGDVASEDATVRAQPASVPGPEQHRGHDESAGRRPREDDADDRRERQELAVSGDEREDPGAGVARRPEHEFERPSGLGQVAQQSLVLERRDARRPQRCRDQAVVDLAVDPPREQLAERDLERGDNLLHHEGRRGEREPDDQSIPGRRPDTTGHRGRHPADHHARRHHERHREHAEQEVHPEERREQAATPRREQRHDPQVAPQDLRDAANHSDRPPSHGHPLRTGNGRRTACRPMPAARRSGRSALRSGSVKRAASLRNTSRNAPVPWPRGSVEDDSVHYTSRRGRDPHGDPEAQARADPGAPGGDHVLHGLRRDVRRGVAVRERRIRARPRPPHAVRRPADLLRAAHAHGP